MIVYRRETFRKEMDLEYALLVSRGKLRESCLYESKFNSRLNLQDKPINSGVLNDHCLHNHFICQSMAVQQISCKGNTNISKTMNLTPG